MANKKTQYVVLTSACIACLMTSGVLAAYDSAASVTNNLSLDTVDIELSEYSVEDNKEVEYEDPTEELAPGAVISKIPRITNLGADAYLRVKIEVATEFEDGTEDSVLLSFDDIEGMDDSLWTLCDDGYYYYTSVFESEAKVNLFTSVTIPLEWDNNSTDADCRINITAEAIQSDNFTQDLESDDPWVDEEIEECVRSRDYRELSDEADNELIMSYSSETKDFIISQDDMFVNFASMMPGDTAEDTLLIQNNGETQIELFFSSTSLSDYELEEDEELLDEISLTISVLNSDNNELTELYSGNLLSEELETAQSIGTFEAGFEGELKFELSIPDDLKNEYNMTETKVQWNFGLTDFGAPTTVYTPESSAKETPKTGLSAAQIASYWLLAASILLMMVQGAIVVEKKSKNSKGKGDSNG